MTTTKEFQQQMDGIADLVSDLILSNKEVATFMDNTVNQQLQIINQPLQSSEDSEERSEIWWIVRNELLLSILMRVGDMNRTRYGTPEISEVEE